MPGGSLGAASVFRAATTSFVLAALPISTQARAQTPKDTAVASQSRQAALNTALSLALPGVGQLRQGRSRGWVHLAAEAAAWTVWAQRRHRGRIVRQRYRDLAWETGRLQDRTRIDGPFPYYEAMTQWSASGAFDAAPTLGLQPETDPATFNGAIWALARDLFDPGIDHDPDSRSYIQALKYYRQRAYEDAFLWDWSGDPEAQEQLADLIEESDDRFREATVVLGAVLANHLLSAVDTYLASSPSSHLSTIRIRPAFAPRRAWTVSLRIGALP